MAGGDGGGARARIEIERHDDVRSRRDHRRSRRASAANSRSTGSQRRVHGVYLLDLSTAAYGIESEAADWRLRISANASCRTDSPGQYRQHSKLLGDARPGYMPDRAWIRRERFRLR